MPVTGRTSIRECAVSKLSAYILGATGLNNAVSTVITVSRCFSSKELSRWSVRRTGCRFYQRRFLVPKLGTSHRRYNKQRQSDACGAVAVGIMPSEDVVKSFKKFLDENCVDYFVIEISNELLPNWILMDEGKWKESGTKDYMLRIDPENPATKQQRNVHIAKTKHINSKTMQASWNEDGSKHDKTTFNKKIGYLSTVQSIARSALALSSDITLVEASKASRLLAFCESINSGDYSQVFSVQYRYNKSITRLWHRAQQRYSGYRKLSFLIMD